jgi:hypothetical protein
MDYQMKSTKLFSLVTLLAMSGGVTLPATAQNVLGRIESDIRQANGQPTATFTVAPKVYLGATALDNAGGGVRITGVRNGGPAQRAGLQTQDLVVGAAGKPVQVLSELTDMLGAMKPGDRVPLDIVRGTRRMRIEVVLGTQPGSPQSPAPQSTEQAVPPPPSRLGATRSDTIPTPPTGAGAGRTDTIPPPPGELPLPSPADGPALSAPVQPAAPIQPVAPNNAQVQIEELRHRVDQLERRVQELEKALQEARKK